ncbi:MAG: HAMP domain-containing histidine kinase [Deltaproteobacteria bacterium]|nr:HAMP domain-containing histidine kinase [Deltaproteobacteria bacterium]
MLHEFLIANRGDILSRSRAKLAARQVPTPTASELVQGLPMFLDQLIGILQSEKGDRGAGKRDVTDSAAQHGGDLLRVGLTVGQVVQDYGSICQSVTELAGEKEVTITADEFQTFNSCLDDAIAQAVTSFEHQRDRTVGGPGAAHLGFLAHEMRNLLSASMLAFDALTRGSVGINGSTGAVLGRSLRGMRVLIDRTLAEVRLEAEIKKTERVSIAQLIEEIGIVATLEANDHKIGLSVDPGPYGLTVDGDHQILASVVANLVQNAFKFTRPHGHIKVSAHKADGRVLIQVEDECGGLPPGKAEGLFQPFEQRSPNQTGLGLGLSISMKGVRASGGELRVHDLPGTGCIFTVDLPSAAPAS